MPENIVFIGPMGAGKTTLGKKIAKELNLEFTDTDKLVAGEHGAISKLFETKGEEYFRELETAALRRALDLGGVISTGGGIVLREVNRKMLSGQVVIFLDTAAEHVLGKVNLSKRPLLKNNPESWTKIYNERLAIYQSLATATIFTGGRGIRTLMNEIREVIAND